MLEKMKNQIGYVAVEKAKADVVAHVKDNKKVYLALGVGVVVGTLLRRTPSINYGIKGVLNINPTQINTHIVVEALGHPGDVIQCVETGTIYASQGQAARELGVHAARISEHLAGKIANINGNHLKFLGKAGHVFA